MIRDGFPGAPDNMDAAFVWSGNGRIYFIKGSTNRVSIMMSITDTYNMRQPHHRSAKSAKFCQIFDPFTLRNYGFTEYPVPIVFCFGRISGRVSLSGSTVPVLVPAPGIQKTG